MNDEKLIEVVEQYTYLYDRKDELYKSNEAKKEAWDEIGKILKVDGIFAMKRWNNLRERFSKEIRNVKKSEFTKQWRYLDRLMFLKTHIIPRPMRQSAPTFAICDTDAEVMTPTTPALCDVFTIEESMPALASTASSTPTFPEATSSSFSCCRKRRVEQLDEVESALMKTLSMAQNCYKLKVNKHREIDDEITGFGMMIGAAVAKLKKRKNQLTVMRRCTEIVMQAQLEEAEEDFSGIE